MGGKKGKGSQEGWFGVLRPQRMGGGAMKHWKEVVEVIEERQGLVGGE